MQKIATYLLERRDGMASIAAKTSELERIRLNISDWLRSKGGDPNVDKGIFTPQDNSSGKFIQERAVDGAKTWHLLRLDEVTSEGRRFLTNISTTTTEDKIAVYVTLEAGSDSNVISPVEFDPKCPRIVRTFLNMPGTWYHGASPIKKIAYIETSEHGDLLAAEIRNLARSVPVVAISRYHGELALPNLDNDLASDLAGIANVAALSVEASWALTMSLGKRFSCYNGAIRIYWPRFSEEHDSLRYPLWTAERLRQIGTNFTETSARFRKQLRTLLMRSSALSVVRPRAIDEIRDAASRRVFAEMQASAKSVEEFRSLAESYANENDKFREQQSSLQRRLDALELQVVELEADRSALIARLDNAELQLRYTGGPKEEIAPDASNDLDNDTRPKPGEIRYYKKRSAAPGHDNMIRVDACNHDVWQSGHKGDKARKGILKLEELEDMKNLMHCAKCTGGGLWKVKW